MFSFGRREMRSLCQRCSAHDQPVLEAIEDKAVEVSNQNISDLSQTCNELEFQRLLSKVSVDAEPRSRILALEERISQ
jgi:hypothetical protein